MTDSSHKKRVLSGMRPTGRLHIGHFFGALENWVKLQNDPQYECFFFVADWHALTSDYADTSQVAQNSIEIATDWLASGLDRDKCTMFIQSSVPEHAELQLLLSMVTPLGWLERVPTYKEALDNVKDKDLHTYGFLGYPVLQTGDIVLYGQPGSELVVPVGEDQASHVELSREIVRRFDNYYSWKVFRESALNAPVKSPVWQAVSSLVNLLANYSQPQPKWGQEPVSKEVVDYIEASLPKAGLQMGADNLLRGNNLYTNIISFQPVLVEPGVMLTQTPRIPGLDGRKMSKSYGNAITLSESDADIRAKTKVMVTDPARKRRTDPGNPDVCPVYDWHKLFSPPETLKWSAEGCRSAGIGCIECKAAMADNLIKWIGPVRARREEYAAHPDKVLQILDDGSAKAREVAQKTMARVREAVFNWKEKRAEVAGQLSSAKNVNAGD
ncbi:MAG TPA: tryptophan--tRNA ligase [Verrucomicrobiae bacterium]|nr:tryptophan--tRNA ligase [Verrucomicrobiae bacterium]